MPKPPGPLQMKSVWRTMGDAINSTICNNIDRRTDKAIYFEETNVGAAGITLAPLARDIETQLCSCFGALLVNGIHYF